MDLKMTKKQQLSKVTKGKIEKILIKQAQKVELENENADIVKFLVSSKGGIAILAKAKNAQDLEKRVRKFHKEIGIPKWDYEDDNDSEGIDWVTFSDVWKEMKNNPQPKIPKYVFEYGNILEYPFLYAQLIQITVSIYQAHIRQIAAGSKKPPRHPRTLLGSSFYTAKNNSNYLNHNYLPSQKGIQRSIDLTVKDVTTRASLQRKGFLGKMLYGVAIGDYIDCNFREAVEKYTKKINIENQVYGGSANLTHSCPITKSTLLHELKIIRHAMDEVFRCDTAFGDCDNNAMSSGHCMLSALILQDLYGGKIKGGSIGGIPHYWNTICHYEVDLTGDQFRKPKIQIKKGNIYKDSYEFKRSPFESLNQDFNQKVWTKHCKFRKRLQAELREQAPHLANKLAKATAQLKP